MFGYYLQLALRSLGRNRVLTTLMVLALALGIGACITTLAVLRLLSGDPLPGRSAQLYYPQIDPYPKDGYVPGESKPQENLTWVDANELFAAHRAQRQALVALGSAKIQPRDAGGRPFFGDAVMTTAEFLPMVGAPFRYGGAWSAADDAAGARVVVIAGFLNQKLFGGANSVGRTLRLNGHDFRVVGVLDRFSPQPRFYAINLGRSYGDGDGVFLPLRAGRAVKLDPYSVSCWEAADIEHLETAPCMWLGLWVELPDAAAVANYKRFLDGYVREQIARGRFHRTDTALPDLMQWLRDENVVPDDARLQAGLAFGFLLICVTNTIGLLLAKCLRRSREIGVRRALGATRGAIFGQFMVEAAIVGLAGGLLGLVFAELGLWGIRHQPAEYAELARLDLSMFVFTFIVALLSALVAGLLPAWRACAVAPAPQLKSA
ncbi:ABC transporter permease [Frateuria hangzhouensis]|uniref:ABC transporter permease n=1 Tax=Frateuria hangzhouensis TaxID=2995589 RepID=UPI00226086E6|nr:ABC transporter permease [Frateuria sp. STR12]MCX7513675.1 ABC transporter permease [Frateuria sp. STR12]